MKRILLILLPVLFCVQIISAQQVDVYSRPERFERSKDYDALHYKLKFKFDEVTKTYWGENTITLTPLKDGFKKCVLDARDFTVTSVTNERYLPLKFKQTETELIVYLARVYNYEDTITFTVKYYEQEPKTGLTFKDETPDNPAQITTFAWAEGARHWFPCFDFPNDKVTNELIATVKSTYKVLSNGKLVGVTEDTEKNTKTYHWLQDLPHPTYNIMMAAGPYVVLKDALGKLPVNYWVYAKDVENAPRTFRKTPGMIDFFNKRFGYNYPWAKYDQVCIAGFGGGMENTSATTLGHGTIHEERAEQDFSSEGLVAHELAHQWWGDLITERTWEHVWLSESFATFSEYLWSRFDKGEDEGAVNLLGKKNSYLREAHNRYMRPLVFNRYNQPWEVMDAHSYPKGATVLQMLRFVMGEEPFFRSLQCFLHKHEFQSVDTHDLMKTIKEVTGQNLDWFFEQWVYKAGHPVFNIGYTWDENAKKVKLKVVQTQETTKYIPIHKTPVIIGIVTPDKKIAKKVWIKGKDAEFEFAVDQKPLMVRFDEDNYLLKEWTFDKSAEELLYQLNNDDVIGRMWAATELLKYKDDQKAVEGLMESAGNDPFWAVRRNAVQTLGTIQNSEHIEFFKTKCTDENSKVRTAALSALGDFKNPDLIDFLKERFQDDDSYVAQAEALRALGKYDDKTLIPFLQQAAQMKSPRNMIKRTADRIIETLEKLEK